MDHLPFFFTEEGEGGSCFHLPSLFLPRGGEKNDFHFPVTAARGSLYIRLGEEGRGGRGSWPNSFGMIRGGKRSTIDFMSLSVEKRRGRRRGRRGCLPARLRRGQPACAAGKKGGRERRHPSFFLSGRWGPAPVDEIISIRREGGGPHVFCLGLSNAYFSGWFYFSYGVERTGNTFFCF